MWWAYPWSWTWRTASRREDRLGRLGIPVEPWQRLVLEPVGLAQLRHAQVVDAPHELAPADDLPDEPLHRVERGVPALVGVEDGLEQVVRRQQEVEAALTHACHRNGSPR